MALKRGRQVKGTAKPKGAKGQGYKKKDKNNNTTPIDYSLLNRLLRKIMIISILQ